MATFSSRTKSAMSYRNRIPHLSHSVSVVYDETRLLLTSRLRFLRDKKRNLETAVVVCRQTKHRANLGFLLYLSLIQFVMICPMFCLSKYDNCCLQIKKESGDSSYRV